MNPLLQKYLPKDEENPVTRYMSDKPFNLLKIEPETLATILQNAYDDNYLIPEEVLIPKLFFRDYIAKYGKKDLSRFVNAIVTLIYEFHCIFPVPDSNEKLDNILNRIPNNISLAIDDKYFKNNVSNIGSAYLKSRFFSYWKGSYGHGHSIYTAWEDFDIMRKIVTDRIGINKRNEVFDLSVKAIINGFKVHKYSISFFKPQVAANIYKHFLGDNDRPIVFDPTAGFGGRMLGFKSVYPDGTYIGNDANIETFNELERLSANFSKIILFNQKLEDLSFLHSKEIDLTFTSIPYFDTEIYSNHVKYENKESWENTFIPKLKRCINLVVNVDDKNSYLFDNIKTKEYKLVNNTSHFGDNTKMNTESIIKCF